MEMPVPLTISWIPDVNRSVPSEGEFTIVTTSMPEDIEAAITTTETDLDVVCVRLERWLAETLGTAVRIYNLSRPGHSGMSSVSVLFDLDWTEGGVEQTANLVARLAPEATAFPRFSRL